MTSRLSASLLSAGLSLLLVLGCSRNPPPDATPQAPAGERAEAPREGGQDAPDSARGRQQSQSGPRPYDEVITEEAVTREGLFKTHSIDDELFFEIPRSELDKDMLLLQSTVASSSGGSNGRRQIVQWQLHDDRVLLRDKEFDVVADSGSAIWRRVSGMQRGAIIESFEIEAFGPDSSLVVEVTDLFVTTQSDLGSLQNVDREKSWIDHVAAFPSNVEVEATQTGRSSGGGGFGGGGGGGNNQQQTVTEVLHWSLLALPENPMMPRLHDSRVGFNSSDYIDYSYPVHRAETRRFIHRHRLEKRNPNAAVSEPVEPIVYWIDPATPDWLKPYVVQGVNAWQEAFVEAGFRNAIMGRVAPTPEEDPDFSLEDARRSVIWWRPSEVANATGGQVVDPRTGEILRGQVNMYHNVQNLVRNWYFVQVGPLDQRAQSLPLPDSLMGRLVQYVVTHEVGHAIGFPHNMKASGMYPVDSLRSVPFLRRMGHTPTLMDYSRFNYVAQPEDDVPPELLIPRVGPYDKFVVKWGYSPIPGASTPEEERKTLDRWARSQDTIPWHRFTTPGSPNDPNDLTEAVGDADAVRSSTLGLENLRRVVDMLIPVAEKPGEDYSLLDELYGNVISQWGRYNGHVAAIVGGAYTQEKYGTGERFRPVEKSRQREAVQFLNQTVFHVPDWVLPKDVLFRIGAEGHVDRIGSQQRRVLNQLFSTSRMERLIEYESFAADPSATYTLTDLVQDLRQGVWDELDDSRVSVNVYRRNLQRAYLDVLDSRLNPPEPAEEGEGGGGFGGNQPSGPPLSDVRPVLRGELRWLESRLSRAMPRAADEITRLHLQDLRAEIEKILDPST